MSSSVGVSELARLDLTRLIDREESSFLREIELRAEARAAQFSRMSVSERLAAFERLGYHPHGLFFPDDSELRAKLRDRLKLIGDIPSVDERLQAYFALQRESEAMEKSGIPGRWTGQMALARCSAPFRIVAWGRRSGKTKHAAAEVAAVATSRPRSVCWVAAPTMEVVSRCFDMVEEFLCDAGYSFSVYRNTEQSKHLELEANGSRIVGVSLHNPRSAAGMAVDFVVIDEAADIPGEAWHRAIFPTLADRQGQALLISSWEGEGNFFFEQAEKARADAVRRGSESDWALFQDASWDINFYMFPQGRRSPMIVKAERELPPEDFLEQFGAIPARSRNLVYPEFKEVVHVGEWPFNKDKPVILAVDPSGGAKPYAVAVIQEYEGFSVVVDEFYETHTAVEEISPILNRRPWRDNVTDVVIDSSLPVEMERWLKLGWPVFPVPDKPQVYERIPIYRNLLRNPIRFHEFYRKKMAEVLAEIGLGPDDDLDMDAEHQRILAVQVEERLSDINLSESDIAALRSCSGIFFHKACVHTQREHRMYRYHPETKRRGRKEIPMDKNNDLLDALGYYAWTFKRFSSLDSGPSSTYLSKVQGRAEMSPFLPRPEESRPEYLSKGELFLREVRRIAGPFEGHSLLEMVR